ncbi:MAG TPA: cytochrome ubiquinol oxidase subunit I, partial [Ktedonobacteraceae bacterium]|nr:cytochrome ubiquinol oxidase subunit I [Ktedonobacteraceae bacterium]
VAVICGWMVTEMGRQPWVINGFLRTSDAVTPAPWVSFSFLAFVIIYLLLAITLIRLLLGLMRQPLPQVQSLVETYSMGLEESAGV